jgi:hypothetical protein
MNPGKPGVKRWRKRITVFKVGNIWTFKYFFGEKEIFKELADHYKKDRYRFEFNSMVEMENASDFLEKSGFDIDLVEDSSNYLVKMDKSKKYAPVLKNSVEYTENPRERIFLMKDLASVEEALNSGAEIYEGNFRF